MAGKVKSVSVVFQAFTERFEKKVDSASDKMVNFGKKALVGVGSFVAARATISGFMETMDDLVQLANTSRELKVSPEFIQGLDLASKKLGFSFDKAKDVMREFNIRMGEARTGAGPAINGLELLNMKIEDFNKLNPEQGFLKVADALSKIKDPQLQIFAAGELFGGAGEDMIGLLQEGEEGLQKFIDKAKELQGPITKADLDAIRESDAAVKDMQTSFDGLKKQLVIELGPVVKGLAVTFEKISKIIRGFGEGFKTAQKALEIFFIEAAWGLDLLTGEEAQYALSLDDEDDESTGSSDFDFEENKIKTKSRIENIKTFAESLMQGSAEAFRALNPSQQVDVQKEQLSELKKQTAELANIGAMVGADTKVVSF